MGQDDHGLGDLLEHLVDGATRGQCIRYLTLPLLKTTAIMLFIMNIGKIFNGDFGMIYNLVDRKFVLPF